MNARGELAAKQKIEALIKILDLEKERGYLNTAVMGGLDRFLEGNMKEAGNPEPLNAICNPDFSYAGLRVDERRTWAERARLLLTEELGAGRSEASL